MWVTVRATLRTQNDTAKTRSPPATVPHSPTSQGNPKTDQTDKNRPPSTRLNRETTQAHEDAAEAAGSHPFHAEGYGALAARLEKIAGRQDLPAGTSTRFAALLEEHEALVRAGEAVANVLPSYRKADETRAALLAEAAASDLPVTDLARWQNGKEEAGALMRAGKAMLERSRFGVHLDRDPADRALVARVVAAAQADMLLADALDTWRTHSGSAGDRDVSPFDAEGVDEAMAPLRALAARDGLAVPLPRDILDLVEEHGREMRARDKIDNWRRDADGIEDRRGQLIAEAAGRSLALVELPDWKAWWDDALSAVDRGDALADDPDIAGRLDRNAALRSVIDTVLDRFETAFDADEAAAGLLHEWETHVGAARLPRSRPSRAEGHDGLVARMEEMAESADRATAERLPALVQENERREREQVREDAVSHYRRILDRTDGRPDLLPYQYDYNEFRAALREAREVLGPDFEGVPADLDARLDAADGMIARLKTLTDEALELSDEAVRLQGIYESPRSRLPAHEREGFHPWRARADRFLAAWEAVQRDPAMAPHLDRSSISRDSLELTAELFRGAELQAPEIRSGQEAERLRRDRSEGGGMKL